MKKIILLIISFLMFTSLVSAEEYSERFKQYFNSDGVIEIKAVKPANDIEAMHFLGNFFRRKEGISFADGDCFGENFDVCNIYIEYEDEVVESYEKVPVKYVGYNEKTLVQVKEYFKDFEEDKTFNIVDLENVNYWVNSYGLEDGGIKRRSVLIGYSGELKAALKNRNFSIMTDTATGGGDIVRFADIMFGDAVVMYKDVAYMALERTGGLAKRIIYVPTDTNLSSEDLMLAAQKRINDYLKNEDITIVYGGKIADIDPEELNYSSEYLGIDITTVEDYFIAKYKDTEFEFLIIPDSSKMINPKYSSVDMDTSIEVNSSETVIPLDTLVNSLPLSDDSELLKLLNLDYGESFDIKLYSQSLQNYFIKLNTGEFEVKIPVSDRLKNAKKLMAYYVDNDGKVEEHEVSIKDGYIIFKTNHFSVYTLGEVIEKEIEPEEEIITPPDTQVTSYYLSIISGLLICLLLRKVKH